VSLANKCRVISHFQKEKDRKSYLFFIPIYTCILGLVTYMNTKEQKLYTPSFIFCINTHMQTTTRTHYRLFSLDLAVFC